MVVRCSSPLEIEECAARQHFRHSFQRLMRKPGGNKIREAGDCEPETDKLTAANATAVEWRLLFVKSSKKVRSIDIDAVSSSCEYSRNILVLLKFGVGGWPALFLHSLC
jgi:hypothetical protein